MVVYMVIDSDYMLSGKSPLPWGHRLEPLFGKMPIEGEGLVGPDPPHQLEARTVHQAEPAPVGRK